jgi:hypothetical protein
MSHETPEAETARGRQITAADPADLESRSANVPARPKPINGKVGTCHIENLIREGSEVHLSINGKALRLSIATFLDARKFQTAAIELIGEAVYYRTAREFREEAVYLLSRWEAR